MAVVGDADPQHPVGVPDVDPGLPGFGVLGHVGQQLADREVGGRFDRGGRAALQIAGQVDPHRAVQGQRPDRVGQAAVGQHRRVDAADQVTQFGQGLDRGVAGLDEQRPGRRWIGVYDLPRGVQGHAHGDQPGLRSVVQVPLDPADFGGPGVEGLGAGLGQVPDPQRQLGLIDRRQHRAGQQAVAAQQPRGRHEPGRDDRNTEHLRVAWPFPEGRRRHGAFITGAMNSTAPTTTAASHSQQPAHDQVHHHPQQVPPGGRVLQQPAESLGEAELPVARGQRQVRFGDRHAAPLARQPSGQAGQPSYRQQRARPHGPADAQPSSDPQQGQQHTLVTRIPVADDQDPEADRGQAQGREQDRQEPEFRQHQPGQRQPPRGGHQARDRTKPRSAALRRDRGDHHITSSAAFLPCQSAGWWAGLSVMLGPEHKVYLGLPAQNHLAERAWCTPSNQRPAAAVQPAARTNSITQSNQMITIR